MNKFFSRIFEFIKNYPAVFYSVFLIIFLPLLLFWNTFFAASKFEKISDSILQKKALFLESTISVLASDLLDYPEILQEKLENLLKINPELKYLRIVRKEGEDFKILNSFKREEIGAILDDPALVLSWFQNQNIASSISSPDKSERLWRIVSPVFRNGEKIALISLSLSLKETDKLIEKSVFNAFLITIFGILISLFLVFQHINLFGYVALSERLKEIDKAKDEFFRMATHELQSPIANIRGYLAEVKERLGNRLSPQEKEDFERIEISAKNLTNLIEDILKVSRIEQGRLDFTPKRLSLNQELSQIFSEFERKAKEKNLELYYEKSPYELFILANPFRFREVIANLLENAIKYTFRGFVKLVTRVDLAKKRCYIFVIDSGIGISAPAQRKLFQKFFREKKKETADIPGTGLGLWITKEIVEKMGGEIFVESIEGQGSKFIVSLPLFQVLK